MVVCGPPCAHFENAVARILPLGDSLTVGVEDVISAGYRYTFKQLAGSSIYFVGSQVWAGEDNGLAADPYHEGRNGYWASTAVGNSITPIGVSDIPIYHPDLILSLIGTNDIFGGNSAATVAASISTQWDMLWAAREFGWMQIVGCTITKRYDAFNTVVQAVNAMLPAIAAAKPYAANLTFIDVYDAIGADGMFDAVHYNALGAIRLGTAMYNAALPAILRARPR